MNVSNFFKFIGEKFPEYKLSSDNENLRKNFFDSYEKDVIAQNIDNDHVVSVYFAVENESTMDENGKNGKFVQYSADAELYRDSEGDRDIEFRHYKNIIDFKNDVKDGNDELYHIKNGWDKRKIMNTEYKNGKKVKRVRYRYFYEVRGQVNGPYIDNVTHYDSNGDEYAVDFYRFVANDESGIRTTTPGALNIYVGTSEISYRKVLTRNQPILYSDGKPIEPIVSSQTNIPGSIIYYDTQGNEISKEEWNELIKKR
jgi:hypothetical protein